MKPIYKFELATEYNGVTNNYAVYPLYKDDLAMDYEMQQNERFYRAKLSGKLLFVRSDYAIIANARFETQFTLVVSISWNNGQTWDEYWHGEFWKTDCKFDTDAQTIEVTPSPVDDYTAVLAGMEKEYNLIELKPEIENLTITKRPLIQIYVPGESVVSCFLSGMYWEQDCDTVTNETDLEQKYYFALNSQKRNVELTQTDGTIKLPSAFVGDTPTEEYGDYQYDNGDYSFHFYRETGSGYVRFNWDVEKSGVALWRYSLINQTPPSTPFEITLQPISGTEATGTVNAYINDTRVYARLLVDTDKVFDLNTYPLPENDIVENNRNYRRAIGYSVTNVVFYSTNTTTTPTEWGIKLPGEYWEKPSYLDVDAFYPIGRSHWGNYSIWFAFSYADEILEQAGRKEYILKDAYPLHSVISVLLAKIAPSITHEPTAEYSQFLYGSYNPISGDTFNLYITPKSNILSGDYSQPAQKAPITLKMLTDMLRNCYRAYWYVEDGKFKVEHIQWFKNGGRYTGPPIISHDLTIERVTRNGKPWAFGTSQYDYNKPTMPERYQFGWMDDVSSAFKGFPIEVVSKYVTPGNIEEINVANFTTDIDYMLLNPGGCSKDGFALMAAIPRRLVTPDSALRTITIGAYNIKYALINPRVNEGVKIKFQTNGGGICEMVFLDALNNVVSSIDTFNAAQTEHTFTIGIPANATQIAVRQLSSFGTSGIKMLSVFGASSIPFIQRTVNGVTYMNQNGLLAFINLQPTYYVYDLPAYNVRINEASAIAYGITREKKQSLRFPVQNDPNPMDLIKTYLGNGQVEKISVNLSSRNANATLMFDTYKTNE